MNRRKLNRELKKLIFNVKKELTTKSIIVGAFNIWIVLLLIMFTFLVSVEFVKLLDKIF